MPVIVYSALRLALLVLALVAGALAGLRDWLLVVVATLVAWGLSYVLLAGPRDAAALWLAERAERRRTAGVRFSSGVEADEDAEDAEADAVRRTQRAQRPNGADGTDGTDGGPEDGPDPHSDRPRPSSTP